MYKCKYCGKEFEKSHSYAAHLSNCKLNPNLKRKFEHSKSVKAGKLASKTKILNNPYRFELKEFTTKCLCCGKEIVHKLTQYKFDKGDYKKYCSISCANSSRKLSDETKNKIRKSVKSFYKNRKESNSNDKLNTRICEVCGKEFIPEVYIRKSGRSVTSSAKTCSKDCRNSLLSLKNKLSGSGGFRENSVKSYKHGTYNGIRCDSSWELAFVIWNLEHGNKIERCSDIRTYLENGIRRLYYPDFIVNDSIIYEIKGIKNNNSILKQQYNQDIIFLYKEDMKNTLIMS